MGQQSLLDFVQDIEGSKDEGLVGLDDLPVHDHLIQDVVGFLDVVHDVQLADVLEVFVHGLDQIVDKLQVGHLILSERSVPPLPGPAPR